MKKLTIEIEAKFGSKFQQSYAEEVLLIMLKSLTSQVNHLHKKNEIKININDVDVKNYVFIKFEER